MQAKDGVQVEQRGAERMWGVGAVPQCGAAELREAFRQTVDLVDIGTRWDGPAIVECEMGVVVVLRPDVRKDPVRDKAQRPLEVTSELRDRSHGDRIRDDRQLLDLLRERVVLGAQFVGG